MDKQKVAYSYYGILFRLQIKKKEIPTHTVTQVNFEDIMLSEISQIQKDTYCMIPLIWSTWNSQVHKDQK